ALDHVEATMAAEETGRMLAVLEAPDDQPIAAERLEKPPALTKQATTETDPLKLGSQVDFVDLAVIGKCLGAVEADCCVTGDCPGHVQDQQRSRPARRLPPPCLAAPLEHLRQRLVRNEARI